MKNKLIFTLFLFILFALVSQDLFAAHNLSIFPNGQKPGGFVFTISLFLAFIAALGVHELGHLITGLAQGFRFELFVIFLLGIKRTEKGIQFFLNRNIGYMGGVAATVPTKKDAENRRRFANMVLAGPVSSLLFAVVCFLFLIYTRNDLWTFWLVAGATSIGIFFATTLPTKTGIYFTDRARFQRLISKGQEGKSEEALLNLIAQTTIENSCINISLEDAQELQADEEAFMRFWGHYYEYEFFKANKDLIKTQEAKVNLLNLREAVSNPVWKALKLDES